MEQQSNQQLRNDLEEIQAKAEILSSTLLAIYAAQESGSYGNDLYMGALHGAVNLSQELVKAIMETICGAFNKEIGFLETNSNIKR